MESLNRGTNNARTTTITNRSGSTAPKQTGKTAEQKAQEMLKKFGVMNLKDEKQVANKKVEEFKQGEIEEELEDGGECNICMCVMVEPIVLPCGHVYCAQCALHFLTKKSECPLDRKAVPKNFKLQVNKDLQDKIRILKPVEFAAMEKEIRKGQGLVADQVELEFEVGNRYELLKKYNMNGAGKKELKHCWSLYVKPLDAKIRAKQHLIIDKVKLFLHPTFREPTRWIKGIKGNMPIELANVPSWGSFEIEVTIFWSTKTGQQIPFSVTHDLVFEPQGAKKVYKVKFDNTKLAPLVDPPKKVEPKKAAPAKSFK